MDHIFACLSRKNKNLVNVLSDEKLFEDINFNDIDTIKYDPDHNLDEDSWFKIEGFSKRKYFPKFLKDGLDSKYFDLISKDDYKSIKFLISLQDSDFYFQKVLPSSILKKKGLISFGANVELKKDENNIIINGLPHAIYFAGRDILIFRNLPTISSIFKGIDELYREATNEEVTKFLEQDFILLSNGFSTDKVSKLNRKSIALVTQSFNKMSGKDREDVLKYIQNYCNNKNTLIYDEKNKKFTIEDNIQLKNLLYGLDQRFFETPVKKEKRVANSIKRIN